MILGVVIIIMIIIPNVNTLEREVLCGVETCFRPGMHRDSFSKKPKAAFPSYLETLQREGCPLDVTSKPSCQLPSLEGC